MKKAILSYLVVIFISLNISAQKFYEGANVPQKFKNVSQLMINEESSPEYFRFTNEISIKTNDELKTLVKKYFNYRESINLKEVYTQKDKAGNIHTKYQLFFQNIPFRSGFIITHKNSKGIYALNGTLPKKLPNTPKGTISSQEAIHKAINYVNAELYKWEIDIEEEFIKQFKNNDKATWYPYAEKIWVKTKNGYELCYQVPIYAEKPFSYKNYYLSAQTGKIEKELDLIHYADENGTAVTMYSGEQTITTDSYQGTYRLRETGRGNGIETYNMQMGTNYGDAVDFTDDDNYWDNQNAAMDEIAGDAHWATEMTYDYYFNEQGRNSIDNNGLKLISYVHFNLEGNGYPDNANAFWNGQYMTYGDGNDQLTPLTAIDICAHEITHGLTSYSANLDYQSESGALNEGFSDIFGCVVENYARPDNYNWTMGEDVGIIIRSAINPESSGNPDTYEGNNWEFGSDDNGGVHTNSTVLSHWFYLLSEGGTGTNDNGDSYNVSPIGITNAADVAYILLTSYLTNTSQFVHARFYGIMAAIDLFGPCSPEVASVTNAFYAVGIGSPYQDNVLANFNVSYPNLCQAPASIYFENNSVNGMNYTWDFGDGNTDNTSFPSHTYQNPGNYTVKLIVDGGSCGSDTLTLENYINIGESDSCVSIFPADGGNSTLTGCSGNLLDCGGNSNYLNDYDAVITIIPDGASQVILNMNDFDVEPGEGSNCDYDYLSIYDGEDPSASLIGQYCNNSPPPSQIISSGQAITLEFHSDNNLALSGFNIGWQCIQADAPPTANFTSNQTTICNVSESITFNNHSFGIIDSYEWDFGDGNTSQEETPSHIYEQEGTYTVSLTVTNEFGENTYTMENYIVVDYPAPPSVSDTSVCTSGTVLLQASSENTVAWYETDSAILPVDTGAIFEVPGELYNNTTFYVADISGNLPSYTAKPDNSGGGGYFGHDQYYHYLEFDAFTEFKLHSVKVYAEGAKNRTIALRDNNENIIQQKNIYIPNGESTVILDFDVPEEDGLQLAGIGDVDLYRNNEGANYPYEYENVVSITKSSAGSSPYDYYYYFYDWFVIPKMCKSALVPMNVSISNPQAFTQDSILVNEYPYQLNAEEGMDSYLWENGNETNSITVNEDGWYNVEITDETGCTATDSIYVNKTTGINNLNAYNINIYPNPASNKVFIKTSLTDYEVKIITLTGKTVYIDKNVKYINTGNLSKGVYILNIRNATGEYNHRLSIINN